MLLSEIFTRKPIPIPPQATTMYHCTLARHMDSIMSKGLTANKGQNYPKIYNHPGNRDIKYKPGVWLTTSPEYSQSWIHEIAVDFEPAIILEVNTSSLDQSLFREDPFIPDQGSILGSNKFAYLYQASIPKSVIKPWGTIATLDSSRDDPDDPDMSAAYYGGKQVRRIKDHKEWQAMYSSIKRFFGLPDAA